MAITDVDRATIIRWSGPITDESLTEAAISRFGAPEVAALEILQNRLSLILSEPVQQAADGDASWNNQHNVRGLERQIDRLAGLCAGLDNLSDAARGYVEFLAGTVGEPRTQLKADSYEVDNVRPG